MSDPILTPEEWATCTDLTPRRPDADFERRWALLRAHDAALRARLADAERARNYEARSANHHMRQAGHLGESLRETESRLAEVEAERDRAIDMQAAYLAAEDAMASRAFIAEARLAEAIELLRRADRHVLWSHEDGHTDLYADLRAFIEAHGEG